MKKLSVCVTFYNQLRYVDRALESILSQNMEFPFEILVCDDGSSDGTYEYLVEKYGNSDNIRIFQQERDRYIKEHAEWRHSRAITRLLKEVRGEYCSILDGDDFYCDPDNFRRKIAILDKPENQDCVICVGNFYYYKNEKKNVAHTEKFEQKRSLNEAYFGRKPDGYIHLATGVFRSAVISKLEEEYSRHLFMDVNVYFWILTFGKRYYDEKPAFCYWYNATGLGKIKEHEYSFYTIQTLDIRDYQWKKKYHRKEIWKAHDAFLFAYKHRKEYRSLIDYDLWEPVINEFKGMAYEFVYYQEKTRFQRFVFGVWFYLYAYNWYAFLARAFRKVFRLESKQSLSKKCS